MVIGALAHPVPVTLIVTVFVAGLVVIDPQLPSVIQSTVYVPGAVRISEPCEPTDMLR